MLNILWLDGKSTHHQAWGNIGLDENDGAKSSQLLNNPGLRVCRLLIPQPANIAERGVRSLHTELVLQGHRKPVEGPDNLAVALVSGIEGLGVSYGLVENNFGKTVGLTTGFGQ